MTPVEQLAQDHWMEYVCPLLVAHEVDVKTIELIEFHYVSAFIHGYKHGSDMENPL